MKNIRLVSVNLIFSALFVFSLSEKLMAVEIGYTNFSNLEAIGPPAEMFSTNLKAMSTAVLGEEEAIVFSKLSSDSGVASNFENIVEAVSAGSNNGGLDAAYVPALSINPAWGFIYTSGVPFGPKFDEFMGFLYGKSVDNGTMTGLELFNEIISESGKNIIVLPIVGGSEQGSGYFMKPIGKVVPNRCLNKLDRKKCKLLGRPGIGLKGLCVKKWKIRYIPIARDVLDLACDNLLEKGKIPEKNISFIDPTPGAGVYESMISGEIQAFEVSTPLDDIGGLFQKSEVNPGTIGARYLHYPGWHQPFLITYMMINKGIWNQLSVKQKLLLTQVSRENVMRSYSESLSKQGEKLHDILNYNDNTATKMDDIRLVLWRERDLRLLKNATDQYLINLESEQGFSEMDRENYIRIVSALKKYIATNKLYWEVRSTKS
ncbi:MAG: hypothetical protein KUG82_03635 [Pseudomonadales bacterium]|nr:hypothetical protein [Pseudomonadales bacterium]